jgi:hypothetical protein
LSRSAIELLVRYGRTRVPLWVYLPLAVFLWTASLPMDVEAAELPVHAPGIGLAFSLAVQFRLWDDLADVEEDRKAHPERVLVQAGSLDPFYTVAALMGVGNYFWVVLYPVSIEAVASFLGRPKLPQPEVSHRFFLFTLLTIGFLGWYLWLRRFCRDLLIRSHVVLIKYPVFVALLAVPWAQMTMLSAPAMALLAWNAAVVYLTFCCYEVLHDDRLRSAPAGVPVLSMELLVLFLLGTARLALSSDPVLLAVLFGSVIVLLVLFLMRRRARPGLWPYAVFVVTFLWMAIPLLPRGFL